MSKYKYASEQTRRGTSRDYADDRVEVRKSMHLASKGIFGLGLYAKQAFDRNDVIIEYLGRNLTLEEAHNKASSKQYMFDVKQNNKVVFVLDGANNKYASAAKFINAADYQGQQNAKFIQHDQRIYCVATKRIPRNNEILAWYGDDTHVIIGM